jgi:hypothetical protein
LLRDRCNGACLEDLAAVHDDELIRQQACLRPVMGDHEDGNVQRAEMVAEIFAQGLTQIGVEGGKRLVEKEEAGLDDKGAREGDALLLATGDLARAAVALGGEVEALEHRIDAGAALARWQSMEAVRDVVGDAEMGEEGVVLEDEADATLLGREVNAARGVKPHLSAKGDAALLRALQSGQTAEHSGFPTAGGAQQDGDAVLRGGHFQLTVDGGAAWVSEVEVGGQRVGHG